MLVLSHSVVRGSEQMRKVTIARRFAIRLGLVDSARKLPREILKYSYYSYFLFLLKQEVKCPTATNMNRALAAVFYEVLLTTSCFA